MTVLLFVATILVFLGIHLWTERKAKLPIQAIMFDNVPGLGFTMADGGEKYEEPKK